MKISIITITYNSAKTLPRALASVQQQTYPDIEHIIVDGASTDGTVALIEAYAQSPITNHQSPITNHQLPITNIKYLSEPDNGIYDALNKGIRMATGDVIGFLHSDDVFYSADSLAHIAAAF